MPILNVKLIKIFIFTAFNLDTPIMHYKCNDAGRCDVILIDKGICYLLSSSIRTQQLIM